MPSNHKLTVFLADDSVLIRERLQSLLTEITGVAVIGQTEDGLVAVNSVRELKPDVVILDISMPGKNGLDVLRELKKFEPAPCIIVLTGHPNPQYREKCLGRGADHFLDKSTDFDRLPGIIKQLGRKNGRQRDLKE
jgi:DNA-binding NarL/FixJ family response regulator